MMSELFIMLCYLAMITSPFAEVVKAKEVKRLITAFMIYY